MNKTEFPRGLHVYIKTVSIKKGIQTIRFFFNITHAGLIE